MTAADAIGPVYSAADAMSALGVTKAVLDDRVRNHEVLAIETVDGVVVFPAWQFDERGQVLPGVAETLQALATGGMDDFTHVLWFNGPSEDLDGKSASEWLTEGHDPEVVVQQARRAAHRWLQ
ncbi:hypothetical protein [Georgenia yuyongxinii]|uniref:DNA-binding protein n=1 Tax=Georgenia yuyongxinii TaxID=2589797 RepID=A0A552WU80_9MICO|nr:hypothetical protein [Georgenia yuyongxinii]TRW46401.1 hypothetical protein FJ693_05595 [Georgenia yuyongxinii]